MVPAPATQLGRCLLLLRARPTSCSGSSSPEPAPRTWRWASSTAVIAAWMSLQLLPPGELALRPVQALALFLRFLWQSVVAGVSVARIALTPVMPLRPGIIAYRTTLPPRHRGGRPSDLCQPAAGHAADWAVTATAASPSTASTTAQPVAEQLAAEEEQLSRAPSREARAMSGFYFRRGAFILADDRAGPAAHPARARQRRPADGGAAHRLGRGRGAAAAVRRDGSCPPSSTWR